MNAVFRQLFRNERARVFQKIAVYAVFLLNVIIDLGISDRVEILQREIFQLLLDALHTKAMRQGRINVHGLKRRDTLFIFRLCGKGAHIMQAVAQLDKDHTDIFRHGKQHLAQVFHALFFFIGKRDVHKIGDRIAEFTANEIHGDTRAVLNRIMQKRRADGIRVKLKPCHNFRNRYRMRDISLAAVAELPLMHLFGKQIGCVDFVQVVVFPGFFQNK